MYNQFLNRVAGNRENVYTDNYDFSYLKLPKSNTSLSFLVKSSKYGKWNSVRKYTFFYKQPSC